MTNSANPDQTAPKAFPPVCHFLFSTIPVQMVTLILEIYSMLGMAGSRSFKTKPGAGGGHIKMIADNRSFINN